MEVKCAVDGCGRPRYEAPSGWHSTLCAEHRKLERRNEASDAAHQADWQRTWTGIPLHVCEKRDGLWITNGDPKAGWWRSQQVWSDHKGHPPGCPVATEQLVERTVERVLAG